MWPYRELVDLLFSAAHGARHFKRFDHVYFHNCIYERVYSDARFHGPIPLKDLFLRFDRETRLVLVGDAHMYPGEITDRFGAIDWTERNEQPGVVWLKRVADHFSHRVWLNPDNPRAWIHPTVRAIGKLFPMYPLTIDGLGQAVRKLVVRR